VIRMNAASRKNALTGAMAVELSQTISQISDRTDIGAMILCGTATGFCAGAHLKVLAGAASGQAQARQDLENIYSVFAALRSASCLTIAAVQGPAVGAGFNLALACDVRIAAENAVFQSRFLTNRVHPGGGHLTMLNRVGGWGSAARSALTDRLLSGREAYTTGIVEAVVPADEAESLALSWADAASSQPELARTIKASLQKTARTPVEEAARYENEQQALSLARIGQTQ
jgi:enoyl-CoA hydratase